MIGVSVALVDDHPIMLNGLSQVLASESKYRIIAQCESTKALQIVQEYRPQLVVLGIQDAQRLISTVSAIASQFPAVKSLVYAATPTVQDAVRALEAGAKGYASKAGGVEEILQAIQLVHDDKIYISRSFAAGVITALSDESIRKVALQNMSLTGRENQIVHLLLQGKTNKEIASHMQISEKTVKYYMTSLMQKLNARNRTEAVLAAQKLMRPDRDTNVNVSPSN
jgi:DNA-binding NarL/FixJ family response regulator